MAELRAVAEAELRSMNSTIILAVEEYVGRYKAQHPDLEPKHKEKRSRK
jgi:hypothetical protein